MTGITPTSSIVLPPRMACEEGKSEGCTRYGAMRAERRRRQGGLPVSLLIEIAHKIDGKEEDLTKEVPVCSCTSSRGRRGSKSGLFRPKIGHLEEHPRRPNKLLASNRVYNT